MNTAIYLRVSTTGKDSASQEPDLERWAAANATESKWYPDYFSGKTMDRPGWARLEADMRAGKVDRIVVWRLDRLGRTAGGLTALFVEMQKRGVELVSVREGLELSTSAGRLMADLFASVALYETEVRAEPILAGQKTARAKGKKWGGSKPGRPLKVTPEDRELALRLKSEGKKIAAIARAVGLSRNTVYKILKG